MPLANLKPTYSAEAPQSRAPFAADPERIVGLPSPARLLQQRLEHHAGVAVAPRPDKWPLRQSAALIVSASFGLWAALLAGATQIYHAIA